jgi:hypothetical protein
MRPMLDNLSLPQVQEIRTLELRSLAEHKPPEMSGSLLQNLGRKPALLQLWGVASGPDARQFLEDLEEKFRAGSPVPFTADIAASAEIAQFALRDLRLEELAGKPERFAYVLTLSEFIEPAEPANAELLDDDLLAEASGLMDEITAGLDLLPDFATGLERFIAPLTEMLDRVRQFNAGGTP